MKNKGTMEAGAKDAIKAAQRNLNSWRKISRINIKALTDILSAFGTYYQAKAASRGVPAMADQDEESMKREKALQQARQDAQHAELAEH